MFTKPMSSIGNKLIAISRNSKIFDVGGWRNINQGIAFTSEHDQMKSTLQKVFKIFVSVLLYTTILIFVKMILEYFL